MTEPRRLPEDVKPYSQSPIFTAETVPEKLLGHHNLKPGTWGLMHVEKGNVQFFVEDQQDPIAKLNAQDRFVIVPEERHYIKVSEDARLYIEFWK